MVDSWERKYTINLCRVVGYTSDNLAVGRIQYQKNMGMIMGKIFSDRRLYHKTYRKN
jgi:hypothetical protein